ncbi:phage tail assembly protein T [Salmonella enterica]|nr:phage tail assembly protein T [Salmonella enterica]EJP1993938.1 phage tail assembly protein T [Salmonella enterica]EJV4197237.1 phage tail assembly protein T [Salmonella enterica]EKQ2819972.1 phage tail assembly protein T [Salmonella enterica]
MNNELHFVRQLAREFRRPDWRRMLDEMSSTELSEWADFFRENSFSDALLDAEFSTLKAQVFMLVTGREIDAADFSLLTLSALTGRMVRHWRAFCHSITV